MSFEKCILLIAVNQNQDTEHFCYLTGLSCAPSHRTPTPAPCQRLSRCLTP